MDFSSMTVAEIRKQVEPLMEGSGSPGEDFLQTLASDPRAGVRNIYRMLERRRLRISAEEQRLEALSRYEKSLAVEGIHLVAGVDEAGRGPLAGPVMASAVILPLEARIYELNDSKQLSPAKRKALAIKIKKISLAWAIGVSTVNEILELNIYPP
ncbi:MAG: ribonuclease HII, partial [Firmicutes bacterium]|nr:ribonuclease HII [Bacillota bacterium]